ncbi:MAG: hypothetical protein GX971_02650 [Firmicutes bacterium]|nr:hypothetical protein [Bacillota bacterium]
MIELLNHCIELHNPTDAERKVLKVLMRSVDFKEEDYWDTGVVDMSLPQLAKEAGVSLWELIRALFFWQSVALISIDVGREENDDIILFCQPYAFIEATGMFEAGNESNDELESERGYQGFLLVDLDTGSTIYSPRECM